ncbi:uncharacterized protein SCODWIG_01760 [Saccharomycodes ludwigii]|uniref:Trafficking protein particle complex II-specific subunit 130 n=1 Tax=Saccharomycodes ludwigii TaxID=36035 RepID=A0A376B614_9ASCO|nr:hypothetical protein SCDLUD_002222 [Saccharomycodes ludwigii]KAH3902401.1 hypothetical protein SCDLUD_002222 [Saccharomycodes ludwigii]SSD59999.1 uncharacterized protein SCODWIG_01760 [Saccharomycodes ludwigii]
MSISQGKDVSIINESNVTPDMKNMFTYGNGVIISYFDPLSIFDGVKQEISNNLPLKNLHWKPRNTTNITTINELNVQLLPEIDVLNTTTDKVQSLNKDSFLLDKPFVSYIVINCSSIDEYRSKIRPLVKQWLSSIEDNEVEIRFKDDNVLETTTKTIINEQLALKDKKKRIKIPIIRSILLLKSTEAIHDSKLFKSVSLMEKFTKDFPNTTTYEIHTVYRSETDKYNYWINFTKGLKQMLLKVFEERLDVLTEQIRLDTDPGTKLLCYETLFKLYKKFHITTEAQSNLNHLKATVTQLEKSTNITLGDLDMKFFSKEDVIGLPLTKLYKTGCLTRFQLSKIELLNQLALLDCSSYLQVEKMITLNLTIKVFITNIKDNYGDSEDLSLFLYEACEKILNFHFFQLDTADENLQQIQCMLNEIKGDLLMIKRDAWLRMVYDNSDIRLFFIQFDAQQVLKQQTSKHLLSTFSTHKVFTKNFIMHTTDILSAYKNRRERLVDILSIQIGFLYYQNKEYKKAVEILKSSYEYYLSKDWYFLAVSVLEKYATSLEHLKDSEKTITIEGEDIPIPSVLTNGYLNLVSRSLDRELWWVKFLSLNEKDDSQLVYSIDELFAVSVDNDYYLSKPNVYAFDLTVFNDKVFKEANVSSIKLLFKNSKDEYLKFLFGKETTFHSGSNKYVLETKDIIFGKFDFVSLEFCLGNTILNKEFSFKSVIFQPLYNEENFDISITSPSITHLGFSSLGMDYFNENKGISDFHLKLTVLSPSNFVFANGNSFLEINNDSSIKFVEYNGGNNRVILKLLKEVRFTKNGESYSEKNVILINNKLDLVVSVEDIYKNDLFYFNFLINSSDDPIYLHKSILKGDYSKYDIIGNLNLETPLLLDPKDEDCNNFYRIKLKDGVAKFDSNDEFLLELSYNTLKDVLDKIVTEKFFNLIENPELSMWKNLWVNQILPKFQYNKTQLLCSNTIKLSNYNLEYFMEFLNNLVSNKERKTSILNVYQKLFEGVTIVNFDSYLKTIELNKLSVPVTILEPRSDIFLVEMLPKKRLNSLCLGKSYKYDIHIVNKSEVWSLQNNSMDSYIFEFIISNNNNNNAINNDWLITGCKRFAVTKRESFVSVELIPVKRGYLRYPRLEITTIPNNRHAGIIPATVDFLNAFEYIIVV